MVGQPIDHSLSPLLHQAAYAGLDLLWAYDKYEVGPAQLKDFLTDHSELSGVSVTMPLKYEAAEIAHDLDSYAAKTRAANTLIACAQGWSGFNTDVLGFMDLLRPLNVTSALVIGSGATAASALVALNELDVPDIHVVARNHNKLHELLANLELEHVTSSGDFTESLTADLVLSTVPPGVSDGLRTHSRVLFDVVYAPWPTDLIEHNAAQVVLGGLDLLVAQAVHQVRLMTGVEVTDEVRADMYRIGLVEQGIRSQRL